MLDFIPTTCQWIDNDGHMCGASTKIDHPWCDHHRKIVFETPTDADFVQDEDEDCDWLEDFFEDMDLSVIHSDEEEDDEDEPYDD